MEIDFSKIPEDNFERIALLSTYKIEEIKVESRRSIKNYPKIKLINDIFSFVNDIWFDSVPGFYSIHKKVGFVPLNQAKIDFLSCIEQLTFANYRSSYDSLRRMYEMAILQIYFSLDSVSEEVVQKWKNSEINTPNFSKMFDVIVKEEKFSNFNNTYGLLNEAKNHYWNLCNKIHVKGISNSYIDFSNSVVSIAEIPIKKTDQNIIFSIFDSIIISFQIISSVYSLNNPIILVGLPLYEKFGSNRPMSGFLDFSQSKITWNILDKKYDSYFKALIKADEGVKSLKDWVLTQKDISINDNELFEEQLEMMAKKNFLSKYII